MEIPLHSLVFLALLWEKNADVCIGFVLPILSHFLTGLQNLYNISLFLKSLVVLSCTIHKAE